MTVASRISDLRKRKCLTQEELGRISHISQSVLNRIEKGTRPVRDDEIKLFSKIFNVSTDYLLGNEEDKTFPITNEEKTLLTDFKSLTVEGKHTLLNVLNSLKMTHAVSR